MSGRSSTRRYRSTLTRPLWPVGNAESATRPGAFTPPAQTNTPPSTSWPSLSRNPSSVAAAIAALVRTWTPRSERILVALSISRGEEPARMAGPASTSSTAGRSGARPWRLAALGSISASSPASSTPVAPPPPTTTVARRRCRSGPAAAWQVETVDLGLNEAGPFGQHLLQRDAYRIGGAGAAGDPGQLGQRLVVVVPV